MTNALDDFKYLNRWFGIERTYRPKYESVVKALTCAAEAERLREELDECSDTVIALVDRNEQLRKERDELAAFIKKTNPDVVNVPDDIFLICVRAKKDN